MFEDDVEVLGSRDVFTVFNELSADLIKRYPAQILAVVLPEIDIQANGIYTFRIPTDNITPKGTKIFMHTNALDSDYDSPTPTYYVYTPDGIEISGEARTLNYDYNELVNIDSARWQVKTSDVYLPETDANGYISLMRIYAEEKYIDAYDASEVKSVTIWVYNRMPEANTVTAGFTTVADTEDVYTFLNDDGEVVTTVPANKHVNVAAYMEPGYTYSPIITTKASSSSGETPGGDTGGNTGGNTGGDTGGTDTPATHSVGGSEGGCDSGFSFMALALFGVLGLLAKLTKKRIVK